jgi:hypothetical protein
VHRRALLCDPIGQQLGQRPSRGPPRSRSQLVGARMGHDFDLRGAPQLVVGSVLDSGPPGSVCGLVAAVRRGVAPVGEEISVQLVVVSLVCRSLAFIGERVPLVLVGLTPVGQALAFVGGAVTQLGQAFAIGGVLPTPRTGSSPGLDGTFTLGGGRCPVLGLDSSGSGARFTLGVGQATNSPASLARSIARRRSLAICCLIPHPVAVCSDR